MHLVGYSFKFSFGVVVVLPEGETGRFRKREIDGRDRKMSDSEEPF